MDAPGEALVPVRSDDARALIGLLAVLEVEVAIDRLDGVLRDRLEARFARAGLMTSDTGSVAFARALDVTNQRLRHALGEDGD